MPKILLFAACEKVIVDAQSNNPTLISLLDSISVPVPEGTDVPQDANVPIRWDILALWLREPGDQGQIYEQRIFLELSNGQVKADGSIKFEMLEAKQNVMVNIAGFPVGFSGPANVVLAYRKADSEDDWHTMAQYPIQIVHQIIPVSPVLPNFDKA